MFKLAPANYDGRTKKGGGAATLERDERRRDELLSMALVVTESHR